MSDGTVITREYENDNVFRETEECTDGTVIEKEYENGSLVKETIITPDGNEEIIEY